MRFVAFIEADICNRIASLRVLYSGTLKYVLMINILNHSVSTMTFQKVVIRHQMTSLRMTYSLTLTLIIQAKMTLISGYCNHSNIYISPTVMSVVFRIRNSDSHPHFRLYGPRLRATRASLKANCGVCRVPRMLYDKSIAAMCGMTVK